MASVSVLMLNYFIAGAQDLASITDQTPFKINGSVNTRLQFYGTDRTNPSRSPFVWYLQGSPVVTVYGIVLPFSFRLSEQQRDFRQPFNQFGVSPYYKWAKLHLGYRSHSWSTYSLAGHSISGAGLELSPGKFHFGIVSGRLLRPVRFIDNPEFVQVQTPAYRRSGTAVRMGYGTEKNNLSMVLLKARDDSTSLEGVPDKFQITPDENLVISIISKQTIAEKFLVEFEIAQSLYTRDVRSELSDTGDVFLGSLLSPFMQLHQTTSSSSALQGSFGYQSELFSLMMRYQRVEPDFRSMGAYYFATDVSNLTIEPSLRLMGNKLTLGGSFGTQTDNLNNDKNLRTRRTISSARVNYVPIPQYNVNAFYSNYGLAQESGLLSIDTMRQSEIAQATSQFGITQTLNLAGEKMAHNLMLNFNAQKLRDRNEATAQFSEFSTDVYTGSYSLTLLPLNANLSLIFLYTKFIQDTLITKIAGPSAGFGKSFMQNKVNASITWSSIKNSVQNEATGSVNTISMQVGYRPVRNHRFSLRFYRNTNSGKEPLYPSWYENKFDIDYTYTF